ncbi:D-glycero-alpha-D-manno-heptose-1,7-bisphosphate 7-phosphatase [Membranihabitans marinus]|uniref:D-glycero-alpha-D-manno-heptose-1,7-bisphosphate 7-phosphatase n=1 Tax=Membranihabitans marinus TaxID=1227546 RepID=UPI001F3A8F12|nr:HAD-IIIA family hydrolase [Membranihabitans marinus]
MDKINIDTSWSLFLDRDGVINRRIPGTYIKDWVDFEFIEGVLPTLAHLSNLFNKIVVVTNQQGIGKGLMTDTDLDEIHRKMRSAIKDAGGRIDGVYYCPDLSTSRHNFRKPKTLMAELAQEDFPDIVFHKSIMVGDSISDMDFGSRLNMKTIFVGEKLGYKGQDQLIDYDLHSLPDLLEVLSF